MKIVHNYTKEILFECECDTLEELQEYAYKNGAVEIDTQCWSVNVGGVVKVIEIDGFTIKYIKDCMWIECLSYSMVAWKLHGDMLMGKLGTDALSFWLNRKEFIFTAIELSFKEEA